MSLELDLCFRLAQQLQAILILSSWHIEGTSAVYDYIQSGKSEIAIRDKMNGMEQGRTGWNKIERDWMVMILGFKNTIDYCSWLVNEIHQYHAQWTWTVITFSGVSLYWLNILLKMFIYSVIMKVISCYTFSHSYLWFCAEWRLLNLSNKAMSKYEKWELTFYFFC